MERIRQVGKKTAKIYCENETGVNFGEVAGQRKQKMRVKYKGLHNAQKRYKGAILPKGARLVGPPNGKNAPAKAVQESKGTICFEFGSWIW